MIALLLYLLLAIGVSFLCSIAEAVLLSITPSYVAQLEQSGKKSGRLIRRLKDDVDRPLAAILSLNTVAHTVGAAGVGAQAAQVFGSGYVGVTSAVLTFLILVLSEIIPKTLGAVYWRPLAPSTANVIRVLIWLMYPLVSLSELITKVIAKGRSPYHVTREEFEALATAGAAEGHLEAEESRILTNLLRFRTLQVSDVMTPRTVLLALPEDTTVSDVLQQHQELQFSRIPVYETGHDDVTGFVLKSDVLLAQAKGRDEEPLSELKRPLDAVPQTASLSQLFDLFMDRRVHIALVVDEYGGTAGIVSLEDLMETLLGLEIVDEADKTVDMRALARAHWKKRAERLGLRVDDDTSDPVTPQQVDRGNDASEG